MAEAMDRTDSKQWDDLTIVIACVRSPRFAVERCVCLRIRSFSLGVPTSTTSSVSRIHDRETMKQC